MVVVVILEFIKKCEENTKHFIGFDEKNSKDFSLYILIILQTNSGHSTPLVSIANNEDKLTHMESQATGSLLFLTVYI